jgi:DNA-binding CsgD family transcriptional regulator
MFKILLFSLLSLSLFAQNIDIQKLNNEIYENNNKGEYKKSQEKLSSLIQSDQYTNSEKVVFNILLSYTYKRLFDYSATINYLNEAEKYANLAGPAKDSLINTINANKAFVLFDTHKYAEADAAMRKLNGLNYKFLEADDLPKINMQEAYLLFLDKKYKQAEQKYQIALKNMLISGPNNAPMILVKQMQLYNEMGDFAKRDQYYGLAMASADSFKIIKYKMYATEELLDIFKKNKDLKNVFIYQNRLDSLNAAYKIEENLASLHDQKTNLVVTEKDTEMSNRTWQLGGGILVLIGLLFFGFKQILKYKSGKKVAEIELENMKMKLNNYTSQYILQKNELNKIEHTILNERQQEILALMYEGFSNREIADKLFISENTVKYHIKNIYTLLNLSDRSDVLRYFKK